MTGPTDLGVLSELAPELAGMLATVASDIVLVVDGEGVIERVAHGGSEPMKVIADEWQGRAWIDTVTRDTRRKVELLLRDVAATGFSRARQVNHPSSLGLDVPIAYSAVRLGTRGPLLVVGRDMSIVSAMQQRLVMAQQEMEREYWQRRQAETRYQLLFQIATDPVLVVDSASFRVLDANLAAACLFERSSERIIGEPATAGLDPESAPAIEELLAAVRASGRAAEGEAQLPGRVDRLRLSVTPFHSEGSTVLLLYLRRRVDAGWQTQEASLKLAALAGHTADAIVITDAEGSVLVANPGFLKLAQLPLERLAVGQSLANWLGSTPAELPSLLAQIRSANAAAPLLAMSLRGAQGQLLAVELSVARILDNEDESFGFIIRAAYALDAAPQIDTRQTGRPLH